MRLGDSDAIVKDIKESNVENYDKKDWTSHLVVALLKSAPIVDPVHAAGGCYCKECAFQNTTACPAYDAPFMRTSLRIKFCSEGQRKEADNGN